MNKVRSHKGSVFSVAILALLGLAALVGFTGCGAERADVSITAARPYETTAAPATTTAGASFGEEVDAVNEEYLSSRYTDRASAAALTVSEGASRQKIISDAQLEIEVEQGRFQTVFDQARLFADRYGGYLVSSSAYASGEEDSLKSGTVAIRVPSTSFNQALGDAGKLGTLKKQSLSTQDVTEEYVDLEARIKNSEANVNSLVALLEKAKTVDEILYVRSVLTDAQGELEQLKGRLRYLDERTSFSTITMSIYETGAVVVGSTVWGVKEAFKDGLHYIVRVFNGIVRGLGALIPILIVLAIVAYIVYRVWRSVVRRSRERKQAGYQQHPQGWPGYAAPTGQVAQTPQSGAPDAARSEAAQTPEPATAAGTTQTSARGAQTTVAPEEQPPKS
jgi:Tfp pilus assembly protein PilE